MSVPLGSRSTVGVVVEVARETRVAHGLLKPVERVIDEAPVVSARLLELLQWSARYYHQPLGGVLRAALPTLARRGAALRVPRVVTWEGTTGGGEPPAAAVRQKALLALLRDRGGHDEDALNRRFPGWRPVMRRLLDRGLVVRREQAMAGRPPRRRPHPLNREQAAAVESVAADFGRFRRCLLEGVTGSGKTEVYLALCEQAMNRGEQALVLVPEIALTSQTVERFRAQLGGAVCTFHSGLSDRERLQCFSAAHTGAADVVIGTRSAVFLPFRRLALIVVDEEHDASYKQHDSSFRYHARDVAIKRAQLCALPIVLGSATPSLESLRNAANGRYERHRLAHRAAGAAPPLWRVLDLRGARLDGGLSPALIAAMRERLAERRQVLLFLNRRGYAPVTLCRDCGAAPSCPRCDAHLVYHLHAHVLRCHHCGLSAPPPDACADCGGELRLIGLGTEKIEESLRRLFPEAGIVRIDADAVRRKNELQRRLALVRRGAADVVLGTQMLAKGHHFPAVTLVGVVHVDQSLFAPDFRALERFGQLVTQVGGRAGRGAVAGEVMLQTHHPEHPLLHTLLKRGYAAFASQLLAQREAAGLPPYRHLAVVRVQSAAAGEAVAVLERAHRSARKSAARHAVRMYEPVPMTMEKKAGAYRAQLLLSAGRARALHACLEALLPEVRKLAQSRKLRWHVDVDPMEVA